MSVKGCETLTSKAPTQMLQPDILTAVRPELASPQKTQVKDGWWTLKSWSAGSEICLLHVIRSWLAARQRSGALPHAKKGAGANRESNAYLQTAVCGRRAFLVEASASKLSQAFASSHAWLRKFGQGARPGLPSQWPELELHTRLWLPPRLVVPLARTQSTLTASVSTE